MELTNQERKLIERSTKKYQSTLYRKGPFLGWIGVVLFSVGLMRTFSWADVLLSAWSYHLFLWTGFSIIIWSQYALAVSVIGKLSDQINRLQRQSEKHKDSK